MWYNKFPLLIKRQNSILYTLVTFTTYHFCQFHLHLCDLVLLLKIPSVLGDQKATCFFVIILQLQYIIMLIYDYPFIPSMKYGMTSNLGTTVLLWKNSRSFCYFTKFIESVRHAKTVYRARFTPVSYTHLVYVIHFIWIKYFD